MGRAIVEDELPQPALTSGAHGFRPVIPFQQVDGLDLLGAMVLQIYQSNRCRQENTRPVARAVELSHHQILFLRETLYGVKCRASAVGQPITTLAACDSLRDAVGIGEGE